MLDRNYISAIELFEQATNINSSSQCWVQIAYCQKRLLKYPEALDAINIAIDSMKDDEDKSTIGSLYWNRACYATLNKLPITLIVSDLKLAIKLNDTLIGQLSTDPDFVTVRESKEFVDLIGLSSLSSNA